MLVFAIFLTAVFPPLLLTGFFLMQYRRRLGLRLGFEALGLGLVAALVAVILGSLLGASGVLPHFSMAEGMRGALLQALSDAGLKAALPEELAKFAMVWFVIRRSKDCDSGGDLFCAAILVGLGFAAIENVLYIAPQRSDMSWAVIGLLRSVMAIPGHTIDGMFMGYFLALWWRRAIPHAAALLLALALPVAAHTLYDFPIMALDNIVTLARYEPVALRAVDWVRFMQFGVMGVSAVGAIWVARQELVEVYRHAVVDGDLYAADGASLRPWRWAGWGMAAFGVLVGGVGVFAFVADPMLPYAWVARMPSTFGLWLVWLFQRQTGEFLFGLALFPLAFAVIMQMRPPRKIENRFALWPTARPWQ